MTNLLLIISDEHRKDAMGCAGHPIVQTPHLDALAARGTRFTNAYTPSPMCVPTRAALACGTHVHRIGCWDSATPYDGTQPSWMHVLRGAGVDVTSLGKLHFRSGADDNGFSREILPMHVVGGIGWPIGLLRKDPPAYDATFELAADIGTGPSSYTDYDRAITRAAEDFLAAPPGGPWAASVSLVSPHYPLTAPEEVASLYDPADMDLPIAYGAEERPDHSELDNIAGFFDYDRHFDPQKIRAAKAAYYALTTFMDRCVGRVMAALEASGQAEDTVVIYVSDHGDMMGDHGFWTKQVMYEASAGVPMIIAGPGVAAGGLCHTAASLIDIAPTAADVLGVRPCEAWPGASLRALAAARHDPGRTGFSEYHDGGSTTGTFMVRWDRWKYVHYVGHAPQLFDLSADPQERADCAADPACAGVLAEGFARLAAICDPDEVNQRCFADQAARVAALGGRQACLNAAAFSHTPTPEEGSAL